MAVGQAVGAFKLFTGLEPDAARMEAHFRRLLAERARHGLSQPSRSDDMNQHVADREAIADATNPLGLDGIEFIEYATSKPQALGQVLEMMGFRPVARHRSREVLLYRQGDMNVIVNAHAARRCRAACCRPRRR